MEMKINSTKENALLDRKEVTGTISFKGATPSNAELAKEVAKSVKADASLVVVKQIYTAFGETNATFKAHAYASKDIMATLEKKGKKALEKEAAAAKKKEEAAKKAAEEKAAAKEAPKAEEKKEEPKAEKPAEAKPEEKKEEPKAEKPAEAKPEEKKEEPKPAEAKEEGK